MQTPETKKNRTSSRNLFKIVDWPVAIPAIGMTLALILWVALDGANVAAKMAGITNWIADTFGGIYLVFGLALLFIGMFVCFSKYGKIKLGQPNEKPEFGNFTYFCVLFAAGYGVGLTLWGLAEPLYIAQESLFGLKGGSPEMAEMGLAYAFLHWGWIPWAFYGVLAVMYGYYMFNKRLSPRFMMPFSSLLGLEKYNKSIWVKILDGLILFTMIGGLLPMFGFGVKLVAGGLHIRFGINETVTVLVLICLVICSIFVWSAVSGLKKGITVLSKINIWVAIGIAIFVFFAISPMFTVDLSVSAFGNLLNNFFRMTTYTDPINRSGFPQAWTIIYWIWWLANVFMMGIIMATISRGRTIRQALVPIIIVSPIASWFWFSAFSGGAFHKIFFEGVDYIGLLGELGKEQLVFQFLRDLPLGEILSVLYIVLIVVFDATTLDSASLTFSQICLKKELFNIDKSVEPPVILRGVWSILIGTTGFLLLISGIDFSGIQSVGAVMTLPCLVIIAIMCYAFIRDLQRDWKKLHPQKDE